jgi:hypothetical protein
MDDNSRRLDAVEENIRELFRNQKAIEITQTRMDTTLGSIDLTMRKIEEAIIGLQARPGKRWEMLVGTFLTSLVSIGAGLLIGVLIK